MADKIGAASIGGITFVSATADAVLAVHTKDAPAAKELTRAEYAAWDAANPVASRADAEAMVKELDATKIPGAAVFVHVHDPKAPVLSVMVRDEKDKPPPEDWGQLGDTHWPQRKDDVKPDPKPVDDGGGGVVIRG
jgi:hypothetical protein